jgi:broad specificity phosphatase PhoE
MASRIYLARHGQTSWSESGRHTGRTEIPLCEQGEKNARMLAEALSGVRFSLVLTSPRMRARRTCELAGLAAAAEVDTDLAEWDYGDFEGLKSAEILLRHPQWRLFRDGCPNGESPAQVAARADRLITRLRSTEGDVALFSHGHFGRVLGARWVGLPAGDGERLLLDTASVAILAYEHGNSAAPVIALWNSRPTAGADEKS